MIKKIVIISKNILVVILSFLISNIVLTAAALFRHPNEPLDWDLFRKYVWADGFADLVMLTLLSGVVLHFILNTKYHSLCPYFESAPDGTVLTLSLDGILKDIDGLYADIQDAHQSLESPILRKKIKELRQDDKQKMRAALLFLKNDCTISTYAGIAKKLDGLAEDSIISVNTSLPSVLFHKDEKDDVVEHLKTVNEKKSLERKRFQILKKSEDNGYPKDIPTKNDFEKELSKSDDEHIKLWNQYFAVDGCLQIVYFDSADYTKDKFYGDFILYDSNLVLMYDYSGRNLFLLVGKKITNDFAKSIEKLSGK